jgi:hypothetical protein
MLLGVYQTTHEDARKRLSEGIDHTIVKEITGLSEFELSTL